MQLVFCLDFAMAIFLLRSDWGDLRERVGGEITYLCWGVADNGTSILCDGLRLSPPMSAKRAKSVS